MRAKTYVRTMRRIGAGIVVGLVVATALACASLARRYCPAGSWITNPDAFASAQIAAGLRAANR